MAEVAIEVRVSGRVQGVFFRHYTREKAQAEGICGWVRNLSDGDVEAWLQGAPAAVERVHHWLHSGPPEAQVSEVRAESRAPDPDLSAFEILR